jgi:hypothetical protein
MNKSMKLSMLLIALAIVVSSFAASFKASFFEYRSGYNAGTFGGQNVIWGSDGYPYLLSSTASYNKCYILYRNVPTDFAVESYSNRFCK